MMNSDLNAFVVARLHPRARQLWKQLHGSTRVLFDGLAAEWGGMRLDSKIRLLKSLASAGLLDAVLGNHILEYHPYLHSQVGHVLEGIESAAREYAAAGFTLDIPAGSPVLTPRMPVVLVVAALAGLIEKGGLAREQSRWLNGELQRLRRALDGRSVGEKRRRGWPGPARPPLPAMENAGSRCGRCGGNRGL